MSADVHILLRLSSLGCEGAWDKSEGSNVLKSQHGCAWSGLLKNEIQLPYSGYAESMGFVVIVTQQFPLYPSPLDCPVPISVNTVARDVLCKT